jgi:hypothetical protein
LLRHQLPADRELVEQSRAAQPAEHGHLYARDELDYSGRTGRALNFTPTTYGTRRTAATRSRAAFETGDDR